MDQTKLHLNSIKKEEILNKNNQDMIYAEQIMQLNLKIRRLKTKNKRLENTLKITNFNRIKERLKYHHLLVSLQFKITKNRLIRYSHLKKNLIKIDQELFDENETIKNEPAILAKREVENFYYINYLLFC